MALCFAVFACAALAPAARARVQPLVRAGDLAYRGAFLMPQAVSDRKTWSYGGTALAYDPARDGLFAVGHDWYQLSAEVSTPRAVRSAHLGALNRARYLQGFRDATDGEIDETGGTGANKIGGQLVYRDRLYGTAYVYYDAAGEQTVSHWARPSTSLRAGTATGLFAVGHRGAGLVSGYLGAVPRRWRAAFGGPALTGNCCIPIISRTSFGPAAFAFDPTELGGGAAPARPLVYYPAAHPAIGDWDASWSPRRGVLFNGSTSVRGVVFPRGSRSVLFFGTQGVGKFCYGEGTDDRSLVGQPTGDGSFWCYDPDDSSKGTHAYPYVAKVWAYDARRLAAVSNGDRRPWQVRPYAVWSLPLPFNSPRIGGAAYDPSSGRIYVSQQFGNDTEPVIHVFTTR